MSLFLLHEQRRGPVAWWLQPLRWWVGLGEEWWRGLTNQDHRLAGRPTRWRLSRSKLAIILFGVTRTAIQYSNMMIADAIVKEGIYVKETWFQLTCLESDSIQSLHNYLLSLPCLHSLLAFQSVGWLALLDFVIIKLWFFTYHFDIGSVSLTLLTSNVMARPNKYSMPWYWPYVLSLSDMLLRWLLCRPMISRKGSRMCCYHWIQL